MIRRVFALLVLVGVPLSAYCDDSGLGWADLPKAVQEFRGALIGPRIGSACDHVDFPVTVNEFAYGGGEEGGYYLKSSVAANCKELLPIIGALAEIWKTDRPQTDEYSSESIFTNRKLIPPCSLKWHGLSSIGDVEHTYGLGTEKEKIKAIVIDSQNNQWSSNRKEFRQFKWGQECQ